MRHSCIRASGCATGNRGDCLAGCGRERTGRPEGNLLGRQQPTPRGRAPGGSRRSHRMSQLRLRATAVRPLLVLGSLVASLAMLLPGRAGAATITLSPTQDSYLQQDTPTTNFATAVTLDVKSQSGAVKRGVLLFDLSSVPACDTITAATLQLHIDTNTQAVGGSSKTHGVH